MNIINIKNILNNNIKNINNKIIYRERKIYFRHILDLFRNSTSAKLSINILKTF